MIGIVAHEFPPHLGGMQQHAWGLAQALNEIEPVIVYTSTAAAGSDLGAAFEINPQLTVNLRADSKILDDARVDRWLVLNAGYASLACRTDRPVYVYVHSADFLIPWVRCETAGKRWALKVLHRLPHGRQAASSLRWSGRRKILEKGLHQARGIFANSSFTATRLRATFPDVETPITVNHPGIDDAFFEVPRSAPRPQTDGLRLVTVARLDVRSRRKNMDGLLRALAILRDEAVPFELDIIGDGDLRAELEALCVRLGLSAQVRFRGWISQADLIAVYDAANLYVMAAKASGGDVEGFGIVYVEAAARGLPSLASRAGGATEAVLDGDTGVVIDQADPASIAAGLRRFLEIRDRLGDARALRRFAEGFHWLNIARHLHAALF